VGILAINKMYNKINKPTDGTYTKISKPSFSESAGIFDIGEFDIATFDATDDFVRITKPTDSNYTKIVKPIT
jgi:hypothetical protein